MRTPGRYPKLRENPQIPTACRSTHAIAFCHVDVLKQACRIGARGRLEASQGLFTGWASGLGVRV